MVRGERSTIGGSTGFVGRASAAEFELRQAALLRRQLALFGDGDLRRVWGLGPNRGLLGRRVRDLPIAPPGALRAELVSPADYRSVRRDSSFLPALAAGRITEADSTGKRPLAVALNGRIAAVCESFFVPGVPGELFATMLPERAFREGRNRLEVYAQEPGGTLRPLGGA
jgi:hypothetical protein